jgi:surface antigen
MLGKSRQQAAILAVTSALTVTAPHARAQFFTPYGLFYGLDLSRQDLRQLNEAANKAASEPIGTQEAWDNPSTGNRGTAQVVEKLQREGMPCLKLRHDIRQLGQASPQTYYFVRCQLRDGQWKLDASEEN